MANWQFLCTGNKLNNNRSMHMCLFARTASACGAWMGMSRGPCLLHSRRGCACNKITRPSAPASACVQVDGGVVFMEKGEVVFDGVAISDTSATVRRPSAARGPPAASVRRACAGPVPRAEVRWRSLHGRRHRHVPREHAHVLARAHGIRMRRMDSHVCRVRRAPSTRVAAAHASK